MFLHANLGCRQKTVGNGEKPGFPIAMPAPINGDGFQPEIDGGQMST